MTKIDDLHLTGKLIAADGEIVYLNVPRAAFNREDLDEVHPHYFITAKPQQYSGEAYTLQTEHPEDELLRAIANMIYYALVLDNDNANTVLAQWHIDPHTSFANSDMKTFILDALKRRF